MPDADPKLMFRVNLITFLKERFVYYNYSVKKEKTPTPTLIRYFHICSLI